MKVCNANGAVRLWVIALLASLFWGGEFWRRGLWEPDEARYAYVAREMRQDNHWLIPYRSGEYYAHKPPLMFWLNNAFASLNGGQVNRVTSRLPTLLGTILSLWATSRIAASFFGGASGWMAPLVLATAGLFWKTSGTGQIDGLLCGLQMLAFWLLLPSPSTDPGKRQHRWRLPTAYLVMGLAVLAKGPIGLLVPFGSWISFCLFSGQRLLLRRAHLIWGPIVALLPVAAWLGAILYFKAAPEGFFDELLFKQNVGRAAGTFAEGHAKPFWYFGAYFLADFMPWILLLPAALAALRRDDDYRPATHGIAAWLLFVIFFFTLSVTKRNLYTIMAYPAAAILLAAGWDRIAAAAHGLRLVSQQLFAGIFIVSGVAMILAAPVTSFVPTELPISLAGLIPGGAVLLATGIMLARRTLAASAPRWMATGGGGLAAALWITAFLLYPALNLVKCPYALAEAAQIYLPDGQDLLLYRIKGEIQAFYCNTRGKPCRTPSQLAEAIEAQQHGLIALRANQLPAISSIPAVANGIRGTYQMGDKEMLWVAFDTARVAPIHHAATATP